MAVIKAVSSKAGIGHAIDYVTKKEKTEEKLVSGLHCEPETVKEEMQATKELWGKTDGRTYKHYVQSYHEDEEITPEQAHKNAVELAEHTKAWKGHEVLDWLDEYTFPAEEAFSSMEYAQDIARFFVKELVKNGTTTCAAYATVHPASVTALFSVATEYNMCILAGKVMMNRNAPDYLMDTTHQGELDCRSLIEDWDGKGRNHYVITPRFAITSTPDQLKSAGRLHAEYPSTYIQTHLSENLGEIESVLSLCPGHADYLEVYERAGLLTDRSIFGHCVHLTDREYKRLGETGGIIAHCPTSNLFLGSGLFDMREANRYGVRTTLATDVGAGTSFSMWRTMGEAYKVQQLNGYPMTALEAIYKCTLGSARALSLDDRIGSFLPGREADFIVVDYAATSVQKLRMEYLRSRDKWTIENKLFGLQTLGDDRNTV